MGARQLKLIASIRGMIRSLVEDREQFLAALSPLCLMIKQGKCMGHNLCGLAIMTEVNLALNSPLGSRVQGDDYG
jgi:hypothetical protein